MKKTHFMIFKAKNKKMNLDLNIKVGNEIIERVNNTNFLGLIIDDDLSWKHHIIKATSKISKLCGIMVRARHYLPIRTLRTVYNAMVYPYLSYCNVEWASTYRWFATIPVRFKQQRPWRPCWMNNRTYYNSFVNGHPTWRW